MTDERVARVLAVVRAAEDLVTGSSREELVDALVTSTGLSREGVVLALDHHLETEPDARDVERLVASATRAEAVHVVLSANVFVGALRAVALACAAGGEVTVRPSRRDAVFARALVGALHDPRVRLVEERPIEDVTRGEIHVYGHDRTIALVRKRARVPVRGHGSGLGLAWLSAAADVETAADALAADVVAFDQRGCLSPRAVLVEGDVARADAIAERLSGALTRRGRDVPRGPVPDDVRAEAARWRGALTYAGRTLEGIDHVVGRLPRFLADALPPTHRHVLVAPVADLTTAAKALASIAASVVTVGTDAAGTTAILGLPAAREARLGLMQRPPLDGPVDRRGDGV